LEVVCPRDGPRGHPGFAMRPTGFATHADRTSLRHHQPFASARKPWSADIYRKPLPGRLPGGRARPGPWIGAIEGIGDVGRDTQPETHIVVAVARGIKVAVRRARVDLIVVPGATAQHPTARDQTAPPAYASEGIVS